MPTLILSPRFSEDSVRMMRVAHEAGWETVRLQRWVAPQAVRDRDPVVYGEPLFNAAVAEQLGLAILEPSLDWLPGLPEEYRLRKVEVVSPREAMVRAAAGPVFLKPPNEKTFPARVYVPGETVPGLFPEDEATVLLQEIVSWDSEYRFFVLEGAVVTGSLYARCGDLAKHPDGTWSAEDEEFSEAREFLERFMVDPRVGVPPAVVVDVGQVVGRGWAVVEANEACGSGLYGCDAGAVLGVVRRGCIRGADATDADLNWIIERG